MRQHTEEKLTVYREYLKNYLYVMCNAKQYSRIFVWEPFAGGGLDENREAGSALISSGIIDGFRKEHPETDIRLFLNELDKTKCQSLKKSTGKYQDFVSVYNFEAEEFLSQVHSELKKISRNRNLYNLFFIDPYGYTQYSQENLSNLLNLKNSDYLIFVPTIFIYRFKNAENNPARKFVLDWGIQESILEDTKNIETFAEKLKKKLKEKAQAEFTYQYRLKNKQVPYNIFHLFFVTKHIKGAEKFLEAKNKVKEKIEKLENQLSFLDLAESEIENQLQKILSKGITNRELFQEVIKIGCLPKEINPILRRLEDKKQLKIEAHGEFKRRKGAYYLKEKEKSEKIIKIRLMQ